MGEHFSFSRFRLLVALHWGNYRKRYLLALPAIGGMLVVWGTFLLLMNNYNPLDDGIQASTYYLGLALIGCLYSSTIFAEFGSKAHGIAWLGVPASSLEKLLCGLLFSTILFFVGFTLVFYLVDIPLVKIGNELIEQQHRMWPGGYPIAPNAVWSVLGGFPGENFDAGLHVLLVLYFILQALFALGSVYFERYTFVKTIVAFLVFVLFFMVLEKQLMRRIPPQGWNRFTPGNDWITNGDSLRIKEVRVSPWITGPLGLLLLLGIPPVIWIATYFRIKEKQV